MAQSTPGTLGSSQAWRTAVTAWVVSRIVIAVAAIVGSVALGRPPGSTIDPGVPHAVSFLGSWDSVWYLDIARYGYAPGVDQPRPLHEFAFFPALPMIMRIGIWTGTSPFAWGLAANNLGFLAGLVAIGGIVGDRWGERLARAGRVGHRLGTARGLQRPCVHGRVLFGIAACAAYAALRNHWLVAGLLAGAAVLVRPQGALVVLLLVMLAWTIAAPGPRTRIARTAAAVVPGAVVLFGFLWWMQSARGSWTLPFRAQRAWGRTSPGVASLRGIWTQTSAIVDYPFTSDHRALREACYLCSPVGWSGPVRDLTAVVVMLALIVALAHFLGTWRSPWVVYAAACRPDAAADRQLQQHGEVRPAGIPPRLAGGGVGRAGRRSDASDGPEPPRSASWSP